MFQIVLDIEELTKLHQLAERPRIKEILEAQIEKLKNPETALKPQTVSNEVSDTKESSVQSARVPATAAVSVVPVPKYYKDITTYGIP